MALPTYHVSATAGARNIFFGSDLVDGWPIADPDYLSNLGYDVTFQHDPHADHMQHLFFLAASAASTVTSASGASAGGALGAAAHFGKQTRYFRTGMGLPGDENG